MTVKKKYWKFSKVKPKARKDHNNISSFSDFHEVQNSSSQTRGLLKEADQYLEHRWLFFGLEECIEPEINWHRDPVSEIVAPMKFGFDINHRDEKLVGNIKFTWEKNRHHHLTVLAEAYFITKDKKYAKEVETQLKSWTDSNPYLIGVNWTHPLEQGIRLISWVYIFEFLKGSESFESIFGENGFLWDSIYDHQLFIAETYSRGSSANNHLIGEMAGLFISSTIWPIFKESKKWKELSLKILERELKFQTYEDGINKELAFSYQIFVFEFCILSFISDPKVFSSKYVDILKKMIEVMHSLNNIMPTMPNYGDGDEGMALQIQTMDANRLLWLFEFSNNYLSTRFPISKKSVPAEILSIDEFKETDDNIKDSFISEQAGIFAFKKLIGPKEISILFDFGPLGLGSMAAHGHADALSFTLGIDGQMVFIDPGTFCYHTDLKMREYFRSVHAHNTLSINNKDQSEQTGPFLWSDKANSKLINYDPTLGSIKASHDGYEHLGVTHVRHIEIVQKGIRITDSLEGSGKKTVELRFHLHPDFIPEIMDSQIAISNRDQTLNMSYPSQFSAKSLFGEENGGWYSTKFGIKQACHTLVLNGDLSLPINFETNIELIK